MPRAKQRTPELRERVLDAAVGLLANEGVAAFTARNVAREAGTSTPAIYELFGDKAGLVREVFFAGFRLLRARLGEVPETADPRADLERLAEVYRAFLRENPVLAAVMFSRPFADFDPGPAEIEAGGSVRAFVVARVRRAAEAGVLAGDPVDAAHVLVALVQGMAAAELTHRLGTSEESVDRRWALAVRAVLDGLASRPGNGPPPG
ncbi:AcrR family transcriptional regulator [Thermocatellispora tengchongensis]|uniref:AcrR family transcriptional regulator n=1 Tax=Thermocatellispora tengchongensis TaxID=1073253 RepID=A0A840PMQ1_9ACTN|nr:TetR/AcrR family transcriptional regulator [Thermocatellispora tengchongensis]MBB5139061.1 AcrR family transcriptional regulator [Thermocatellispora tengchongensis]